MNLNDLQNAWQEFNRATHIAPIRDEKHYAEMVSLADSLIEVIGSATKHPLLDLFDLVSELIRSYDAEYYTVPDASSREVLRLLMDQHGLAQSDLPEVGNQSAKIFGDRPSWHSDKLSASKNEVARDLARYG